MNIDEYYVIDMNIFSFFRKFTKIKVSHLKTETIMDMYKGLCSYVLKFPLVFCIFFAETTIPPNRKVNTLVYM